jgi:hypothetical protein
MVWTHERAPWGPACSALTWRRLRSSRAAGACSGPLTARGLRRPHRHGGCSNSPPVMMRAGVAVWSASAARAAVSRWGRDDGGGCAGPAASPARAIPEGPPRGDPVTRWRRDVERVNRLLRSGLTFSVEPERGGDPRAPRESRARPRTRPGRTERGRPSREDGGARAARAVLVMALEDGRCRAASCPIPGWTSERGRLLSISRGLSECAMALGLGTGVYRRRGERPHGIRSSASRPPAFPPPGKAP